MSFIATELRRARRELVRANRRVALAIYLEGQYFPHGRFGDYSIRAPANFNVPLALAARGAA